MSHHVSVRRSLYRMARLLGDLHAIERGRFSQRLVRRIIYNRTNKLAWKACRALGVAR